MMAERPDPRRTRSPDSRDAPSYRYPLSGEEPSTRPILTGPVSPYPLIEATRPSSSRSAAIRTDLSSRPPDPAARPPTPGLYDLPMLLARIWSVPAAQRATSGAYATAPAAPTPPAAPFAERSSTEPARSLAESWGDWSSVSPRDDPSLPLAAVPSLTMVPPSPAPPALPVGPSGAGGTAVLEFRPGRQFVAWRRPPCHLAYDVVFPRGVHCSRGLLVGSPVDWADDRSAAERERQRERWMRPATSAASLHRSEPAEAPPA